MRSPRVETGTNLLGRLSTDDWREIARANMQLGSEKEAKALGDIERVMRTDEIEGERVRVIGYAQTEDGSHGLQAVEGVADVVTSLEIDSDESVPFATYTKEMAALCVRTVQNDTAMDYYFPIDRQAIAVAEILPDTSGVPRYIRKLRHYVDKTEEVVEVNDIQDTASKRELIGDLNTILSEMIYGTGVRVECKAYSQEVDATKRDIAVDELHDIAEDAGGVFEEAFYQFSLEEQLEILKQYDDEAHSVLGLIDNSHEFEGECTVMAYRCLPSDLLNVVSWSDVPLQEVGDDKGAELFTVRADRLTVWNPELNEPPSLDGNIQKVTDLPLSFGEPMLMIGDRENDMFYLVRTRDIIGLSRHTEQDVS